MAQSIIYPSIKFPISIFYHILPWFYIGTEHLIQASLIILITFFLLTFHNIFYRSLEANNFRRKSIAWFFGRICLNIVDGRHSILIHWGILTLPWPRNEISIVVIFLSLVSSEVLIIPNYLSFFRIIVIKEEFIDFLILLVIIYKFSRWVRLLLFVNILITIIIIKLWSKLVLTYLRSINKWFLVFIHILIRLYEVLL